MHFHLALGIQYHFSQHMAHKGVINIHPSLLPKYRGLAPYFWSLINGETETGVTIHWVDKGFDTGDILVQQSVPITPNDTIISLSNKCAKLGSYLLIEAVNLIKQDNPPRTPQKKRGEGSYYSWPTPSDLRLFKQRGHRYGSFIYMWKKLTE